MIPPRFLSRCRLPFLPPGAARVACALVFAALPTVHAGVDLSYNPGASLGSGSYNSTHIALQADGKLIAAGDFLVKEKPYPYNLARFNVDGSFDVSYKVPGGGLSGNAHAILLQPDGKALFATHPASGKPPGFINDTHGLERVGTDGLQDFSFRPAYPGELDPSATATSDGEMNAVVRLPDGKLLVGGSLGRQTANGTTYFSLLRLLPDGAHDPGFQRADPPLTRYVNAILAQPDGKVLVAGYTTGQKGPCLSRVNADGSPDPTFAPSSDPNTNATAYSLALQPDGKVLVGGRFRTVNAFDGTNPLNRFCLARLNPDGSTDGTFVPPYLNLFDAVIYKIIVLPDGKILIAGNLTGTDSNRRENGVRVLNPDGSVDASSPYNVATNGFVSDVILQDNGGMLISGGFTEVAGVPRNLIARLGTTVGPAPKLANLSVTVSGVKAKLNQAGTKQVFSGSLNVANSGPKAAKNVSAGVYLSDDGVFDVARDRFLGLVSLTDAGVPKIGKNGKTSGPVAFKFKANAAEIGATAGKSLVVVADPQNTVEETDEKNNVAVSALP